MGGGGEVKFPPLPLTFIITLITLSHYRASVMLPDCKHSLLFILQLPLPSVLMTVNYYYTRLSGLFSTTATTSTTMYSILLVQFTCLTVFFHNLSPGPLWSSSWSGTLYFILHAFLNPIIIFFSQHMPIPWQPVLL